MGGSEKSAEIVGKFPQICYRVAMRFAKVPASLNFSAAVMGSGTTVNTLFLRNSRFEEKLMQLMREQLPWQRNVGKCHCRP